MGWFCYLAVVETQAKNGEKEETTSAEGNCYTKEKADKAQSHEVQASLWGALGHSCLSPGVGLNKQQLFSRLTNQGSQEIISYACSRDSLHLWIEGAPQTKFQLGL